MSNKPKGTAKRTRTTKTTTTAKRAGVPTKTTTTKATAIVRKVAKASTKGAKAFYGAGNGGDVVALAIATADRLPTLGSAGLTTANSKTEAQARREFARAIGAPIVDADAIVHARKRETGGVITNRPENTVRARIHSVARALGLAADTYYAIRADRWDGTKDSGVYIVRK